MAKGYYRCECGKEFDNPQKFNGHKQGCRVHIELKYGSYETYLTIKNRSQSKSAETCRKIYALRRKEREEKWISEEHRCERCGKVMTVKYGSGRFCSSFCSHSRQLSEEQKSITRDKLLSNKNIELFTSETSIKFQDKRRETLEKKKEILLCKYEASPKTCEICGKILPYDMRNRKTCSKDCWILLNCEINKNRRYYNSKRGVFDGVFFDSTYELAFYIYCKYNGINCIKNKEISFTYFYNGKYHEYFPDFFLPDKDIFVETKGRITELDRVKMEAALSDNKQIVMLTKEDLTFAFEFVKDKFGLIYNKSGNNFYLLYE